MSKLENLLVICGDAKDRICSTAILEYPDDGEIFCWDPDWIHRGRDMWNCGKPGHGQMTILPAPKNIERILPDMEELKPCPFCGSNNIELIKLNNDTGSIGCMNPNCPVLPFTNDINPKSKIIKAWNTRKEFQK